MILAGLLIMASTPPSAEAEQLGRRLAAHGVLATLLPLMVAQQTEELVAAHPELDPADRAALRATAEVTGKAGIDKALATAGHANAGAMSVADLRKLVAAAERPEARRLRAAQPRLIAATMSGLQGMDFKKDTLAAFCAKTGKACSAK